MLNILKNPLTEVSDMMLPDHIREVFAKATCLYSRSEVELAMDQMAAEINSALADTNPIFLCTLVGGIIPMGHIMTRLDFPLELDYVHATRYMNTTVGGTLEWKVKPTSNLKDRTVVIVDDILDGGVTLQGIIDFCHEQNAKQVYSVALVDRQCARLPGGLEKADFYGLKIGDHYVFGYGMDYKGYLRNAPGIYMIAPEHE